MSNKDFQNGFVVGMASKGQAQVSVPNPLEYAPMFTQAFMAVTFPENYELALDLPRVTNLTSLFHNSRNMVKLTVKGNTDNNKVTLNSAFRTPHLVILDFSEFNAKIGSCTYMCYDAVSLKEIKGVLDFSECTATTSFLNNCKALEEFRVLPNSIKSSISIPSSPNLSVDTKQSIIEGLATVETAQTLTLNSAIVLTDEQKATIEAKGWTLVQ